MPANKKAPSKKPAPSTKPLWQKLFIKGGPSTSVWIAYRKGDKEFHRDTLGALAKSLELQAVSLVAIDDTWSALRVKRT